MAPTALQIVKRLTAIENRIEPRTPLVRWLDVYKSEADIERQKAEARAEAEARGQKACADFLAEAVVNVAN